MTAVRWGGTPYRSGVLVFVLGAAAVLGYFGPLGYAALAALGGLLFAPVTLKRARPPVEWLVLLALAVWAAVSMAWSPITARLGFNDYGDLEQITAVKLFLQVALYALLVGGAANVSLPGSRRALWVFSVLLLAWSAAVLADGLTDGRLWAALAGVAGQAPTLQFQEKKAAEGSYVLAVLIWPAVAFLAARGWSAAAVVLVAGLLIGAAGLSAWSAVLAVIAGGFAFGLVCGAGSTGARVLGAAFAALLLLTPLIVLELSRAGLLTAVRDQLPASWAVRTDIWSFTADRIAERPFFGQGLDASRTFGLSIPLHPHDAALQLWLELGLVGALIAAAFWLLLTGRIARQARAYRRSAAVTAACTTSYFTVGALSFGVWQEWWLAAGAVVAAACVAYAKVHAEDEAELDHLGFQSL